MAFHPARRAWAESCGGGGGRTEEEEEEEEEVAAVFEFFLFRWGLSFLVKCFSLPLLFLEFQNHDDVRVIGSSQVRGPKPRGGSVGEEGDGADATTREAACRRPTLEPILPLLLPSLLLLGRSTRLGAEDVDADAEAPEKARAFIFG